MKAFYDLVCAIAHQLHLDGDADPLGARKIKALGILTGQPQTASKPKVKVYIRVDVHDPPPWMREPVMLRDGHCIFPRCAVDARSCDLDHTISYQPGGPPGQTRPDNLACLCRRHHRGKTSGLWRYTRTPDGGYLWHGPHGATYLVTDCGTQRRYGARLAP